MGLFKSAEGLDDDGWSLAEPLLFLDVPDHFEGEFGEEFVDEGEAEMLEVPQHLAKVTVSMLEVEFLGEGVGFQDVETLGLD
jgi:hypothetical protein